MKNICVFCSSNLGSEPEYQRVAAELGSLLAAAGYTIIYGGANVGLMRCMAEAAIAGGGDVIGIITNFLAGKHLTQSGLKQLIIVETMQERKSKMAELSDAFIVLPGGFGTMEEMFEVLTAGQLGFHQKPVVIININDYYEHLRLLLNNMIDSRMLLEPHANILQFANSPADAIAKIAGYKAVVMDKWIDDIRRDNGQTV